MLTTPAAAQASQKAPGFSDGPVEFTNISARQRQDAKSSRHAKASRSAKARHTKARATKTHQAKAQHAKPRQAKHSSQPKKASQVTNYEAYLDRHGIEPMSYAYVPNHNAGHSPRRAVVQSAGRAVVQSAGRAVVRSHTRTARQSRDHAPEQPHQWGASSGIVAEARRYIGTNPTGYSALWCAHFMNMVLERTGYRGTRSGLARSFASYGTRVAGPQVGAIAVMSRRGPAAGGGPGGHVGVVSGIDPNGNPIIISGNHNKRVAEAVYPRTRIYAYVMPN